MAVAEPINEPPKQLTAPPVTVQKVLNGQKALVTGANSGIGRAVAIALAEAGADVVVNYVHGDAAAEAVVDQIRKFDAKAYAHRADVSVRRRGRRDVCANAAQFGTIDILVNNAGLQRDSPSTK